jgi:ribokinase/non-canonical purine NTP pyrophosphatase (RdgB/HAM1 family)
MMSTLNLDSDSSSFTSSPNHSTESDCPVLIVGSINQDLTTYTNKIPLCGQTVLGLDFGTSGGGKGANQALAASSLLNSPRFVACCGDDNDRYGLRASLEESGVLCDIELAPPKVPTGVASIVVDVTTGDNAIIVVPGANHVLSKDHVSRTIRQYRPRVVLTQLEVPHNVALEAMKIGSEVGSCTILNPAPAPDSDAIGDDWYSLVDILIPNETELRSLVNINADKALANADDESSMAHKLLDRGIRKAVIVTLGARGALVVTRDSKEPILVGSPDGIWGNNPPPPIVDTVGAGDCFCGTLAAYLSASSDISSTLDTALLVQCIQKACGMASWSVRRRGAQSSYLKKHEVPDMLRIPSFEAVLEKTKTLPTLTFVTGNPKKLQEIQRLVQNPSFPYTLVHRDIDLPELQGEPHEIAREKCRIASEVIGGAVMTEDTSLCFTALGGLPGPYIKWFLQKCGHDGLNDMLKGFVDHSAVAQTILAISLGPGQDIHILDGRTDGTIVQPRGSNDFGWDPIFQVNGTDKTYAEMSLEEKNTVSHRAKAMAKLQAFWLEHSKTNENLEL